MPGIKKQTERKPSNVRRKQHKTLTAILPGIAVLFFSTPLPFFTSVFPNFAIYTDKHTPVKSRVCVLFVGKYYFLRQHSGRSPPPSGFPKNPEKRRNTDV